MIHCSHALEVVRQLEQQRWYLSFETLAEAFQKELIEIEEVNESGSVPELAVQNRGSIAVLGLDCEELEGAKQNRVFNTSILFAPESRTRIPVNCVEAGRWHYKSSKFDHSGCFMHKELRSRKNRRVTDTLLESGEFTGNQSDTWAGISEMHCAASVPELSSASNDVYTSVERRVGDIVDSFHTVEHQVGALIWADGKVEGFDIVGNSAAFRKLFRRLLLSYTTSIALNGDMASDGEHGSHSDQCAAGLSGATFEPAVARRFMETCCAIEPRAFPGVGLGEDLRFDSPNVCGSALIHNQWPVHTAFFSV